MMDGVMGLGCDLDADPFGYHLGIVNEREPNRHERTPTDHLCRLHSLPCFPPSFHCLLSQAVTLYL